MGGVRQAEEVRGGVRQAEEVWGELGKQRRYGGS